MKTPYGNSAWDQAERKQMQGRGIFDPDFYSRFRPMYPGSTFAGVRERLISSGFQFPFSWVDIGCGTGHSSVSALKGQGDTLIHGVDPDPGMLICALELARTQGMSGALSFSIGTAEQTFLPDHCADCVLVGSAFHWMNPKLASAEFVRILKPRGLLRVFEYQFPKALNHPELNEWIRRRFNQDWRAPAQVPRGTFTQVTSCFRESGDWKLVDEQRPPMHLPLNCEQLVGMILSQSRVFHYEATLSPAQKIKFRNDLTSAIERMMGTNSLTFDFKLIWAEFIRSVRTTENLKEPKQS